MLTESEILLSIKFGGNRPCIMNAMHQAKKYEIVLLPNSPADIWRVMNKKFSLEGARQWLKLNGISDYDERINV